MQITGFAIGLALLWWAVRSAFASPEQRAQLERMLHLPWWQVGVLVGLSALTVVLDGLVFRAVLWPVHRLRRRDVAAVNGVCSALSYLPFKMGLLFRVFYHRTRDGLGVLVIGSWVLATGAVLLAGVVPVVAAGLLVPAGVGWWAVAIGGVLVLAAGGHLLARVLAGERAHALATRMAAGSRVRWAQRFLASAAFARVWAGVHMLADGPAFVRAMVLRVLILAAQGARFWLAAHWLGVELSPEAALLAGSAYNLLQAIAPTGVGGLREWGTSGALATLGGGGMMAVVLAVTATEAATNLVLGVGGGAYLRLDRLLLRSGDEARARADKSDHRRPG